MHHAPDIIGDTIKYENSSSSDSSLSLLMGEGDAAKDLYMTCEVIEK